MPTKERENTKQQLSEVSKQETERATMAAGGAVKEVSRHLLRKGFVVVYEYERNVF